MVINLTELPIFHWPDAQKLAAKELASDGLIRAYELPTILPRDTTFRVQNIALDTEQDIMYQFKDNNIDAIIIQGEPIFVYTFVNACKWKVNEIPCYSPCYDSNGNFVQFRRF